VIFIHGSISDYRTWENQMEPFAKQFHVLAYSRRYHYPHTSAEVDSDYTVQQHSNDLADFINDLNLGAVNLIGSSYGAYAGLLTAINNPDLVKTLVLGEPPVIPLLLTDVNNPFQALSLFVRDFSTGKSILKFGIQSMNPAKKQLRKGNTKEGVRLFANGVLGEGGYEQLPEDVKAAIMDNATALKAELLGPGFPDQFPKKEANHLQVPTLLVYAEKSLKFFHSISDKLFELLPNVQRVFIADASHNMHEENPEAYNEKVLEFLLKHN
jgi:non-heme chloroperoxidase